MELIDEVLSFSREYVNQKRSRTPDRKAKIRQAIKNLTGQKLEISCGTCYLEALFKIINLTGMATSKYEIKRGAVVEVFGHPEMAVTNNSITDAIGDWYMKFHPEKLIYFARYPGKGATAPAAAPAITIIPTPPPATPPAASNEQIPEAKEVKMPPVVVPKTIPKRPAKKAVKAKT
jgi:hypothetical protein